MAKRFDPKTKEVTALVKDLCMPNGIAFSPDERHLYIADTGIFPRCPSVNPMLTAMALAHRQAQSLAERL